VYLVWNDCSLWVSGYQKENREGEEEEEETKPPPLNLTQVALPT
jgi:hypothetical protein